MTATTFEVMRPSHTHVRMYLCIIRHLIHLDRAVTTIIINCDLKRVYFEESRSMNFVRRFSELNILCVLDATSSRLAVVFN